MITGINAVNSNVNYHKSNIKSCAIQPSFTGLSDRMGKKIYNGFYNMAELFPKESTKNPISGKLPDFMFERVKKNSANSEAAVKEIYSTFSEVSNELRDFDITPTSTISEMKYHRNDSTVEKLKNVLEKYKIISKWDDFDIKYIDKGGKGSVWKLDGLRNVKGATDDEFVIKVFHTKSIQSNAYHGCYPEINTATYWMKTFGQETNRGKFFWGDVNDAYMVNKFIDDDVRLPKKFPNPYDFGVKFTDEDPEHIHNVCKKYSYDWGGGVVINQVVNSNAFARRVMHDIKNSKPEYRILQWNKRFIWKPNGNYDSKYAGLTLGIKYLEPNQRVQAFEACMTKRGKYNDRAMGYTLKYLPTDVAMENYKKLAQTTNDKVLKEILKNEIPLLSYKDECAHLVKDDLIVVEKAPAEYVDKYIDTEKLKAYKSLAKQYLSE